MKLSIIVPVYNMASEDKLKHCIDSLLNQQLSDYEIIAVDDCSTDDSYAILCDYAAAHPGKVVAIHSEVNHHQGGAKNLGIKAATGDWIGFVDADDWIAPNMYKKLIDRAEETGADCVGCDYCTTDTYGFEVTERVPNSRPDQVGKLGDTQKRSMIMDGGSLCVKIFRREMILKYNLFFPEDIFFEDNALGNSYMLMNKHYEYIPEALYYYYQHDTSTVHTINPSRCDDRVTAGRMLVTEAKRLGFYEEFKPELEFTFTQLFYVNTLFTYMVGVRPTKVSWVKALTREMLETFPQFRDNKYYRDRFNDEEKKLVDMACKSTIGFMAYYKLLWGYRNLRKRIGR